MIRNLVTLKKPRESDYKDSLRHHYMYSPKPSITVWPWKFNTCCRQQEESIAKFVAKF